MVNSTSSDLAARKLMVMKKIARLDMKKLTATCLKSIAQMDAERAHLKNQQEKLSYESYCYHHRISHSKKKEYEACYKALESESKLNIDDLKIVDTLSNKIQLALLVISQKQRKHQMSLKPCFIEMVFMINGSLFPSSIVKSVSML